jgi:hypothetical protein
MKLIKENLCLTDNGALYIYIIYIYITHMRETE